MKRLALTVLVSTVVAIGASSCAPSIQELNLSQEVVDNLPKDQALSFLQTLPPSPQRYAQCVFDKDGVSRSIPLRRQIFPGKKPYRSLVARTERPGIMIIIVLYEKVTLGASFRLKAMRTPSVGAITTNLPQRSLPPC